MDLSDKTVSFDGQGLRLDTSEHAEVICKQLNGRDVEKLILQGNTFGIEAAERVGLELAKQPNLREAHFKDLFTSRGREEVPEALSHLLKGISNSGAQLTLLDLSDNAIGPIGAPSVIEFLDSPSAETIEKLYLNNCGLGPEGSTSIAPSISRLQNLRELICGRNRLEIKGATNLSRALSEISNLEILKVNQNGIQVEGIIKLAGVLKANKETIREVDLSDNWIKAAGSDALTPFLSNATQLRKLYLSDAFLGNQGFSIICDALSRCPNLCDIDETAFEGNDLHGQKIIDLIELTFADCKPDFVLNLLENDFTPAELGRLEALSEKFTIHVDEINSDNDYDDDEDEEKVDEDEDGSEVSNGYVDLSNVDSDFKEVAKEFIEEFKKSPPNDASINSAFIQLISMGERPTNEGHQNYQTVQVLCEELGLMKGEETRKKKPLARDAIIYIGKRLNELPPTFKDVFQAVAKNNDDLDCGKILFQELQI